MTKDYIIETQDNYGKECLRDSTIRNSNERKPKGAVTILEVDEDGNKKIVYKNNNLVLYKGREMLIQRALNVINPNLVYAGAPTNDEFISWIGVGDGGVRPADPLIPVPPISSDNELNSPVMLQSSVVSTYGDYQTIAGIYTKEGYHKKRFDSVEYIPDEFNDDRYLIVKITATIGTLDANGEQLSEAGLYSAASNADDYSGQFSLFARITFPSLIKVPERRLIFVWYLYF